MSPAFRGLVFGWHAIAESDWTEERECIMSLWLGFGVDSFLSWFDKSLWNTCPPRPLRPLRTNKNYHWMVWMIVVIEFLPGSHFRRLFLSRCLLLIPAAWSIKCCVFGQENFSGSTATGVLLSRGWCFCQENVKAARNLAQRGRKEREFWRI